MSGPVSGPVSLNPMSSPPLKRKASPEKSQSPHTKRQYQINLDHQACVEYFDLITYIEELILEIAAIPADRAFSVLKIEDGGRILVKIENAWDQARDQYGVRWEKGREQFAFLSVEAEYKKWRKDQRRAGMGFPTVRPPINIQNYDLEDATVEELTALANYEELRFRLKDEIVEIVKKESFSSDDEVDVRIKGAAVSAYVGGWENAVKAFGSGRIADAFVCGAQWAKIYYENYYRGKRGSAEEETDGDREFDENFFMELYMNQDKSD
ncbi:hypothetical protein RUND412_005833 [Rhizina undulata]